MAMEPDQLISEIEAFAEAKGWKPSTVCVKAVNNSRLYDRMKRSRYFRVDAAQRLREFMAANATKTEKGAA